MFFLMKAPSLFINLPLCHYLHPLLQPPLHHLLSLLHFQIYIPHQPTSFPHLPIPNSILSPLPSHYVSSPIPSTEVTHVPLPSINTSPTVPSPSHPQFPLPLLFICKLDQNLGFINPKHTLQQNISCHLS